MTPGGKSDGFMSDINVTPFVDVMLVLLIIFMVTAPMMMQGMDVDLPEAVSKPLSAEADQLMVSIDDRGRIFINDIQVAVDDLSDKLKKIMIGRPDQQIYLKADKAIAYGVVVRVMGEIQQAGIEKLGMVTLPPAEKTQGKK